jgi:gliding motility-associated protein GldL
MAKKKGFLDSRAFKLIMKYVYGLGAAIVIGGALFKIMHWPGANEMLILGMGTEVLVFMVSAFEPLHQELDWGRVYPQLNEDYDEDFSFDNEEGSEFNAEEALSLAGQQMKEIEITPDLFESLKGSLTSLKDNVSNLANIEDATVATSEYAQNVRHASGKMNELSDGYSNTVEAMNGLASSVGDAAGDAQNYHQQIQLVTKNLSSLNAAYELELQDTQSHIKSLNQFYGSLATAMKNMSNVADDTETYKDQVAELTSNIKKLNSVYGGMLSAMSGTSGNA